MKQVTPINSAPKFPNWPAAAAAMRSDASGLAVLAHLLIGDPSGDVEALKGAILAALEAQPSPAISIYDRRYTAHIYPEPGVAEGPVYEALRDYAAPRATPDPAMVAIRNREILKLLAEWKEDGPPSPEDVEFWRQFDEDLARARRGADAPAAVELEQKLERVQALLAAWDDALPHNGQDMNVWDMRDRLAEALGLTKQEPR